MEPASDVSGCITVANSMLVAAREWDLQEPKAPTILIIEKLLSLEWRAESRNTAHLRELRDLTFDDYKLMDNKRYLQCILRLDDAFARGLPALHLRQSQSYYQAVLTLGDLSMVQPNFRAKVYAQMIEDAQQQLCIEDLPKVVLPLEDASDESSEEVLGTLAGKAHSKPIRTRKQKVSTDFRGALFAPAAALADSAPVGPAPAPILDDDASLMNIPPGGPTPTSGNTTPEEDLEYEPTSPASSRRSASIGIALEDLLDEPPPVDSDGSDQVHAQVAAIPPGWPGQIEGQWYEIRKTRNGRRIVVACPFAKTNHLHWTTCEKRHAIGRRTTKEFGKKQALAFIGVWLKKGRVGIHVVVWISYFNLYVSANR